MKRPPDEFIEEYRQMRERMKWAKTTLGRGQDVAQAKTVLEEFRRFHEKWRPVITDPKLRTGLRDAHAGMERTLGRGLERIFLAHLQEVIEARKDWWVAEQFVGLSVAFIGVMKEAPPVLRPELEKIHHEAMGREFDPTTDFREADADAAEREAAFRKTLAELETDWPERMDAALRQRLQHLDGPGAPDWQAELDAQFEKLSG